MPAVPVPRSWRQESTHCFNVTVGYTERFCFQKQNEGQGAGSAGKVLAGKAGRDVLESPALG